MSMPFEEAELPVSDEECIDILMHREIHFGGKFSEMIPYYERRGRGVQFGIDTRKISALAAHEKELGQNIAPIMLEVSHAEKIAKVKKAYEVLREVYDKDKPALAELLITDLILTEEIDAENERKAITVRKGELVGALVQLLRSEEMHDPHYPGYGLAPIEAAKCLGEIGDIRALYSLFEEIGKGDFFDEEIIIKSFAAMKDQGKEFLLKVVSKKPLTEDNEKAAIALASFKRDPEVIKTALELLKDLEVQNDYPYSGYLALLFDEETDPAIQAEYQKIVQDKKTPQLLKDEMQIVTKQW